MSCKNSPNILFIMYDQQRYDCVSMSKMYPVKTPNLERIANNGVWFNRAYTPIPVCAPARQALFTGKRPESFGALWNPHIVFPVNMIPEKSYSWTRQIKENGYNTAYIGQWEADDKQLPSYYGFDSFLSKAEILKCISNKYPDVKYTNGFFGESNPIPLEDSYTHQFMKHTINKIDELRAKNEPWYIHLDSPEPHLPCRPSAPFDTMYNPDEIPEWGGFDDKFENKPYIQKQQVINWELENKGWDEWKHVVARYYGIISQYDDAVGKILDHLEATDEIENTIIIYTTDHGDMCGSHRMIDKHYIMYEDVCHVPMAIRWDKKIKPTTFSGYVHNCMDLAPTLMGLLNLPQPEKIFQGENLAPYLLNGETTNGKKYAVSTYNGQQFGLFCQRMIKDDNYKYVWNLTDTDEFYDLNQDPFELKNIINDIDENKKEVIESMRKNLYEELKKCGDPIIGWTSNQLLKNRKI